MTRSPGKSFDLRRAFDIRLNFRRALPCCATFLVWYCALTRLLCCARLGTNARCSGYGRALLYLYLRLSHWLGCEGDPVRDVVAYPSLELLLLSCNVS